jgi:K+-transporting ATPase ATPase B chain
MTRQKLSMFDRSLLGLAVADAFRKLDPRVQWRNPVMFVVYVGAILTTGLWLQALAGRGEAPGWFILNVAIWLWFTLLFANLAEALAEGRSKAQAAALRGLKQTVMAKKLAHPQDRARSSAVRATARCLRVPLRWMRARSPANRLPSFANRAVTFLP